MSVHQVDLSLVSPRLLEFVEAVVAPRHVSNRIAGPRIDPLEILQGTEGPFRLFEIVPETRPVFDLLVDFCGSGALFEVFLLHHSHDQILETRSIVVVYREVIQIEFRCQVEAYCFIFLPFRAVVRLCLLRSLNGSTNVVHDQSESIQITGFCQAVFD